MLQAVASGGDIITRWNNLTREKARKLGLEGFWELHQMEKKEADSINDLLEKQEGEKNKTNN